MPGRGDARAVALRGYLSNLMPSHWSMRVDLSKELAQKTSHRTSMFRNKRRRLARNRMGVAKGRGWKKAEATIQVHTGPCGLRVGMFANDGRTIRVGRHKAITVALWRRRMRIRMQLPRGAGIFAGIGYGPHINRVSPSILPGAQLQALTDLEARAPQFPTNVLSDQSTAGLRRPFSLEHADFRSPAMSGDRVVPTSVAANRSRGLIHWFCIGFASAWVAGGFALLVLRVNAFQ